MGEEAKEKRIGVESRRALIPDSAPPVRATSDSERVLTRLPNRMEGTSPPGFGERPLSASLRSSSELQPAY